MALLPALQATADRAAPGDFRGLHHVILGPSPSGKTTQVREYIEALRAKNVLTKTSMFASAAHWRDSDWQSVADAFEHAKGSILVIDELEKADMRIQQMVAHKMVKAISDNDTLIVVTGATSLQNLSDLDPGLASRMNPPIILTHQFTTDDIEQYKIDKTDAIQGRSPKDIRIAEWRAAKDADLRPRRRITAPKTARFRKPEVSR